MAVSDEPKKVFWQNAVQHWVAGDVAPLHFATHLTLAVGRH